MSDRIAKWSTEAFKLDASGLFSHEDMTSHFFFQNAIIIENGNKFHRPLNVTTRMSEISMPSIASVCVTSELSSVYGFTTLAFHPKTTGKAGKAGKALQNQYYKKFVFFLFSQPLLILECTGTGHSSTAFE